MCEAADERELVVAVVLGPDDYARIAPGGCRESAVCVRELREKCVVIHIADGTGIGVKACALRNPVWCVRHGPDGERVPHGEEVTAEPRRLELFFSVRSQRTCSVGMSASTAGPGCLIASRAAACAITWVGGHARLKPELTGDRELCIGELDRHGIWHREGDSVGERRRAAASRRGPAEQILRALTLLF